MTKLADVPAPGADKPAVRLAPQTAGAHNNLGVERMAKGRLGDAMACFRRALDIDPHHADALNNFGATLARDRRNPEAIGFFERALAQKPGFAKARSNLGKAWHRRGCFGKAIENLQAAIVDDGENTLALMRLAEIQADLGRNEEAIENYRRAIAANPDHIGARCGYADLAQVGADDAHIAAIEDMAGRGNLNSGAKAMVAFVTGRALDRSGRFGEAFARIGEGNAMVAALRSFDIAARPGHIAAVKAAYRGEAPRNRSVAGTSGPDPIFVVGLSRSGKTLVHSLLSQADGVLGADESGDWIYAVHAIKERHKLAGEFPHFVGPLLANHAGEVGELFQTLINEIAPDARHAVFTAPVHYFFIGLILDVLPRARIVYCRRDPMDNCLDLLFQYYRSGNAYAFGEERIAAYIAGYRDLMAFWRTRTGDRILDIAYEDLVGEPVSTAAKLFAFCAIDADPASIATDFHTDAIGHWRRYETQLGPMRDALSRFAPDLIGAANASLN